MAKKKPENKCDHTWYIYSEIKKDYSVWQGWRCSTCGELEEVAK